METQAGSQMDTSRVFCPNLECPARGKMGAGNLVSHGKKRERYKCKTCGRTFCARQGTMLVGLRKPEELIVIVVTLLSYGCPVQAIVHALDLDERTVARWQERAGAHCQRVHEDQVMTGKLDLQHVQADAHSRERMEDDPVDRSGDDGLDAPVVGRRSQPAPRSEARGCLIDDGQKVLSATRCGLGSHGWLGRLPRQYSAGLPRKG